ncbi:MAG: hypothetical protein G01um101418_799 [Parcubacteria group bacterium Gr01-1014_18]|nr:MAG: hypothetical protein Greene041636_681 [Parcubacteria group bacterium Greene0416_36]TSC80101.1 MAG: hypothetical protein G01um101418_799 [Parcubacteria group bacterium Gr01-1014_18]TSC98609.1 MAG: hypothetical protein Greene101420_661 [Parcubacteria group bacterium Greene1014_20]TSD06436.1 MAG: hypothetical protein Greene07142_927 [Parcubacteria group bacterium Greene0714_2]
MLFSPTQTISEILKIYPGAESVMTGHGLHCTSCHGAELENLRDGAKSHGLTDQNVNQIISEINQKYQKYEENIKQYGISITPDAMAEITDILKEEENPDQYLEIGVFKDDFEEDNYSLDFTTEKTPDCDEIKIGSLKILIPAKQKKQLTSLELDFSTGEYSEGFKITRPT